MFRDKTIFISGGSGFIGQEFIKYFTTNNISCKKIIIFSRDWLKQHNLKQMIGENGKLRYFIGDIRDKDRLIMAMKNVDICIHAAAIKDIEACEFNPSETMLTNVVGTQNIIEAAIFNKVSKSILLSTDKACNPTNIYGGSKFMAEKLFLQGNKYSADNNIVFCVARYGNVFGSSGSVLEVWKNLLEKGIKELPITHPDMTRFFIRPVNAIAFVLNSLGKIENKVYIPKLKSFNIKDLATALDPNIILKEIGVRKGEKIHEQLDYNYSSENNEFMTIDELKKEIKMEAERWKN